jgi:hypothetical protein
MTAPAKIPPKSGLEVMFRSLGLGEIIDMAHRLAAEGAVEAILNFAKGLEALNAKIDTLAHRLDRLEAVARGEPAEGPGPQPGPGSTLRNGAGFDADHAP